jgi:LacI family transcriptional regulator
MLGTMSEKRTTMADVARKAGVHVTTVSLALRNHPRLPAATRDRLQALAKELGYVPDPLLKALINYRIRLRKNRRRPTLGYVTNWTTRWGWKNVTAHPEFYEGAREKADSLGYQLEHFWLHEPGLTHGRLSQILYARGINGLILASHGREMGDTIQFDWNNFSAVKIDYFPHKPELHNVTNDQCSIVRTAMRKVMAAGYRRIGFVMHRGWDHAVDNQWSAGFLCEQQNLSTRERIPMHLFPDMEPMEEWYNESKSDVTSDPKAFDTWLARYKPEVLISKASWVLPHLRRKGWRVPRDMAFVDVFLDQFDGQMAGMRQNHRVVGAVAVEILAGQLQRNAYGVPEIPNTTFVEGTWFDGKSCQLSAVIPRRRGAVFAA